MCSGGDPSPLGVPAKDRKSLKSEGESPRPRGEDGELISGECPLPFARRMTFVGVGEEKNLSHAKLRKALARVKRQATKNR
jgi:hypothetical protein